MDMIQTLTTPAAPSDLLRVSDLEPHQFEHLLYQAACMKARPFEYQHQLPGRMISCYFEKPSTRTRVSFAGAAARLGMTALWLRPDELQLGRGEPIADTARVLAGYSAAIVVRTFDQAVVDQIAAASDVPVINALTDQHHPCQALADFLTLRERFGEIHGLRLAYIGDGDNVARSLMEAGALTGVEIVVASPKHYQIGAGESQRLERLAQAHGSHVTVVDDPREAVRGADAVYTDVWVSMGEESERAARVRELEPFRVTPELMALANPHAVFMHCLPAHRGEEVSAEVIDGPASVVWQQAANRLPTEQALLHSLIRQNWLGR
jgi:ornithine carbamoyltransferase